MNKDNNTPFIMITIEFLRCDLNASLSNSRLYLSPIFFKPKKAFTTQVSLLTSIKGMVMHMDAMNIINLIKYGAGYFKI
jgi:hypothetical protein